MGDAPSDPTTPLALSVLIIALAALAPDLDHGGATLSRAGGLAGRASAGAVRRLLGHRGPLHSLLAALGAGVLFELLGERMGVGGLGVLVAAGWAAHVLADAVTDRGVPLLWPLWRRRIRLPYGLGPATGGPGEALLVVLGLALCGGWIVAGMLGAVA